jgi:sterol desaturase/sphingolipid hydroxylase (fatty acid hydroxylase superfamily)
MDDLLRSESLVNACAYFGAIALAALWEWAAPKRVLAAPLRLRWGSNIAVTVLDTIAIRLAFPVAGVAFAALMAARGIGLFNWLEAPLWVAVAVTVAVADLCRYGLHRLLHAVPALWRLHGMHHTDQDYDFTTGLRFHPFESVVTTGAMLLPIAALGAPPAAVLVSETLFIVSAMTSHANIRIPARPERVVRAVFVTPDMHRVHHSAERRETDSNYGTLFPWWDRLFGSYRAQPAAGHAGMMIGLPAFRERRHLGLGWMLLFPFLRTPEASAMPRGGFETRRYKTFR